MNIKINTICFIILLFLLVGAVNASDSDNETLQQTIEQPEDEGCQISVDAQDTLRASIEPSNKLEASAKPTEKLEASKTSTILTAEKSGKTKTSMKASNLKIFYKDSGKITVTLKDSSKKAVEKAKIKITILSNTYSATTDSNGKFSFKINGVQCGTLKAKLKYDGSKKYYGCSAESTITVKSTIKSSAMTKFYTNKASHHATFYDKKGKVLKNTAVKFKLNGKYYSTKTNSKGVAKLDINLKPGNYEVFQTNPKTSQTTANSIKIKTILETKDLTMTENDGSKFSVKVLNDKGKAAANKKVTVKVNGKTYTPKSNSQGIATQAIDLPHGKCSITTEYEGLVHTNQLTVNKRVVHSSFSHVTMIPNYVNVTVPYAFHNSEYTIKTGTDGIIKLPKNDIFVIHISETKYYVFSKTPLPNVDANILGHETYLVPFDGSGVKSDYNEDNLKGDGILISKMENHTKIEFRSTTELYADLFGLTFDKHDDDVEIMTYIQNDRIMARILFYTEYFDEIGLKTNLGKLYDKNTYEINYGTYDRITANNADKIRFTNTQKPVNYTPSRTQIIPKIHKEDLITKFIVNGIEELEKVETISYGYSDLYQVTRGFETLQSYAIINDKVSRYIMDEWLKVNSAYLVRIGIMNVYGMFMAGLETAWLADEIADQYSKEFNVKWEREKTATILGGINLDDTYLHILNADMGMKVSGNCDNAGLFKLFHSMNLPNIEEYALRPVSERYSNNTMNSLNNVLYSIASNNYSIAQIGETIYVFGENNSAIILNTSSGVSNVILSNSKSTYKGSSIKTKDDCCSVCNLVRDIINAVETDLNKFKSGISKISDVFDKSRPLSMLTYYGVKTAAGALLSGVPKVALGLFSIMSMVQSAGVTYRTGMVDEKDWHGIMDTYTFTRAGYLQGKKIYNIPNKNGGYDYVEVSINKDHTLNRDNVKYISHGQTKKLTRQETYQYFTDEYWTPFSMPSKYWDESWK